MRIGDVAEAYPGNLDRSTGARDRAALGFCRHSLQGVFRKVQPIPIPWKSDGPWLISRADVLETSAASWGLSFFMSSVNRVASWLAREMET